MNLPFLGRSTAPIDFRITMSGTAVAAVELAVGGDAFATALAVGRDAEKLAEVVTMSAAFSVEDRRQTQSCAGDIHATCVWNENGDGEALHRVAVRVTLRVVPAAQAPRALMAP